MSSDFNIDIVQLLTLGATITLEADSHDYICHYIKFPDYPYKREATMFSQGNKNIHLSCAGTFRMFLIKWLKDNNVKHEEF